jgi:hypothetical protein
VGEVVWVAQADGKERLVVASVRILQEQPAGQASLRASRYSRWVTERVSPSGT